MQSLVCISHLRWNFVWQRPQHLLARLSETRPVFFVEEPVARPDLTQPALEVEVWRSANDAQCVTIIRLLQPTLEPRWIGHGDPLTSATYQKLLKDYFAAQGIAHPHLWLYTPMADGFIETLAPDVLIYDVMDQLSAFKGAPADLANRDAEMLRRADIVFTGGVSLYRAKAPFNANTHLFPSGVEVEHFARAANRDAFPMPAELAHLPRPILGYFGVIDERMDLPLIRSLAEAHPEWSLVMIGPVVKIAHEELPTAPNIHYLGGRGYDQLPAYLAYFDVALVPFAMNDATRYLSPTKTLEYMAAHKPVVSTPIRDVIELYGSVVRVGHSHPRFIRHVEDTLASPELHKAQRPREDALLSQHTWDAIAGQMRAIIDQAAARKVTRPLQPLTERRAAQTPAGTAIRPAGYPSRATGS